MLTAEMDKLKAPIFDIIQRIRKSVKVKKIEGIIVTISCDIEHSKYIELGGRAKR